MYDMANCKTAISKNLCNIKFAKILITYDIYTDCGWYQTLHEQGPLFLAKSYLDIFTS